MEIVRLENGNVELRNAGVFVWSMPQLPTEIKPIDKEERDHVKIFQNDSRVEYLYLDDITETQVLPDPAVPFSGDVFDLAALMSSDFFFEAIGGGANIYNTDDSLTGDREVDIDGNELSFTNFELFEISSGVDLEIQCQQASVQIDEDLEITAQDTTLSSDNLDIITDIFRLNIPSADAVGKVLAVTNSTNKEVEFKDLNDLVTKQGFIDYNDTSSAAGIALPANVWVDIPNDGLGLYSNNSFLPGGITDLIDTATGYLDCSQLKNGDDLIIRNDFIVTPNNNRANLFFRYVLGSGAGAYTLEKRLDRLDSGAGIDYRFNLNTDYIYMGDDNTRLNPIKMQLLLTKNGTFVNNGSAIKPRIR